MNCITSIQTVAVTLFTGLLIQGPLTAQTQIEQGQGSVIRYRITDLGTLGGAYSYGFGVNNAGAVAGGSATSIQTGGLAQTAFLWFGGQIRKLGTLGGQNSAASGLNWSGEVAIGSETSALDPNGEDFCTFGTHAQCLAAVWQYGKLRALPTLARGMNAFAINVNDLNQVIGYSENGVPDPTCISGGTAFQVTQFEAVLWQPDGKAQELHPLPGDTVGFAFGINNRGQITGASGLCSNTSLPPATSGSHAVIWGRDGTPLDLGNLGGTGFNVATSINNRGEVTGTSQSSKDGNVHAFLWTPQTGMQDLGAFPGAFLTVPPCCNTINDRGEVVGFAIDPDGTSRALIWRDKVPTDLNTLLPKNSPWYLQSAESINEEGQIAGFGSIGGNVHAFLATPYRSDE